MNPFQFVRRRPIAALLLVVASISGLVFGMYKMRLAIPGVNTPRVYAYLDQMSVHVNHLKERVQGYFQKHEAEVKHEEHRITVTSPLVKDVVIRQEYVCLIHSKTHSNIQAFESGYIEAIPVKEGQAVKKGDVMFRTVQTLYQAKLDAENARAKLAKLELKNTQNLYGKNGVSQNEVQLFEAKLQEAQAKADMAAAELNFATIRAPFDGIIDRLYEQQGSFVKEGDNLTTLSDNSTMWVYFNVPEKRYLELMAELGQHKKISDIELRLANLNEFPQKGLIDPEKNIGAIEAQFNPETGNIAFRADFDNPDRLLRHGQTGSVVLSRALKNAIVIPQRATYETLAKRYVFIVDKDHLVHQREIVVQYELEDNFVIEKGLEAKDKIILEGIRQAHDGEKIEYEFVTPEEAMKKQKNHAE